MVPGGGVSFLNVMSVLDKVRKDVRGDEKIGVDIVRRALEEPLRCIANNAGMEGSVIVAKVKEAAVGVGFNALTEQIEDMAKAGIMDPVKVTRSALENAASIASMLLTTEALVAEKPEKEKPPVGPPGGGMPEY
jgi:chaperonin GroEL